MARIALGNRCANAIVDMMSETGGRQRVMGEPDHLINAMLMVSTAVRPRDFLCRIDVDGRADGEVFTQVLAFLGVDATSEMIRSLAASPLDVNGQD